MSTIYVSSLPFSVKDTDLQDFFQQYGEEKLVTRSEFLP